MESLIILISIFILVMLTRIITVSIHELGHAIAGLILFKGDVSIYIGSYGDLKEGLHFKIGRLKVHFKYNLLLWNHGMCNMPNADSSVAKNAAYTLAGSFASLIMGIASGYILLNPQFNGALRLVALFMLFSTFQDLLYNLIPNKKPILLHNGTITYNDGQSLKLLIQNEKYYAEVMRLYKYVNNNEIEKGIETFEKIYSEGADESTIRLGIVLYIKQVNNKRAISLCEELAEKHTLTALDYGNHALAYSYAGAFLDAMDLYNKSLEMNPVEFTSLVNRGYTLILLERYEEAIFDFNKAIEIDQDFAYCYSNRGLAQIKLGKVNDGLSDIDKAIELDDNDAYAFKNLGIYQRDKGDLNEALKFFRQANSLAPKTEGLQELIAEVEMNHKRK